MAILVAFGLREVHAQLPALLRRFRSPFSRSSLVALSTVALLGAQLAPWLHYKQLADRSAELLSALTEEAGWLQENARPGDVVAIPVVGIVPYYTGLTTIDMLGLTDRHIARVDVPTMGQFKLAGHEKNDPAYIISRRPTYIWIATRGDRGLPGTNETADLAVSSGLYEPVETLHNGRLLTFYRLRR